MKNMSFALNINQIIDKSKIVTRRKYDPEKPNKFYAGQKLCAVKNLRGLKKGEKIERLSILQVKSVRIEKLNEINEKELEKEGFKNITKEQFIIKFCKINNCKPDVTVYRIEFRYILDHTFMKENKDIVNIAIHTQLCLFN